MNTPHTSNTTQATSTASSSPNFTRSQRAALRVRLTTIAISRKLSFTYRSYPGKIVSRILRRLLEIGGFIAQAFQTIAARAKAAKAQIANASNAARAAAAATTAAAALLLPNLVLAQTAPLPAQGVYQPTQQVIPLAANALPTNGQVTAGQATIGLPGTSSSGAAQLTINQQSQNTILTWNTFNVGSNASVSFVQPNSQAVALNRVTSGQGSEIAGQINANGQVFLVNSAGVLFSKGAQVNVGGLVASTMDIKDTDFMANRYYFSSAPRSIGGANPTNSSQNSAEINNQGTITATGNGAGGGYVALLGQTIRNDGIIAARLGTVALAAGDAVRLNFAGNRPMAVDIEKSQFDTLIDNKGLIQADGGWVLMSAQTAAGLARAVVNHSGMIEAQTVADVTGRVTLDSGEAGMSIVTGQISAKGEQAGTSGGAIKVLGDKVGLFNGARVDASGAAGGGTVLAGGNWQGSGAERTASRTIMSQGASIDVSATTQGNAGIAVVWADGRTDMDGSIKATGAGTGNGGNVETSGKGQLALQGSVNVRGGNQGGTGGQWLLDPDNINITNAATNSNLTVANPTTVFQNTNGADAVVSATALGNAITGGATVNVQTNAGGALGDGNITVSSAVTAAGTGTLNLIANSDIIVNAAISSKDASTPMSLGLYAGDRNSGLATIANAGTDSFGGGVFVNRNITTGGGRFSAVAGSGGFRVDASIDTRSATGGGDISVLAVGRSSDISFIGNVNAGSTASGGTIRLQATGSVDHIGGLVTGLTARNLAVVSGVSLSMIRSNNITGEVAVQATDFVAFNSQSAFTVGSVGDLTVDGRTYAGASGISSANSSVRLQTTDANANITLTQGVTAATTARLISTGSITGAGLVTAATRVELTAATGIGSAAASGQINTQTAELKLVNNTSGGVYATNTGDVLVATSSTNGDVVIKTADGVATGSLYSGSAGTAGGNITVGTVGTGVTALAGITATGIGAGQGNITLTAGNGGAGREGTTGRSVSSGTGTGGTGGTGGAGAAGGSISATSPLSAAQGLTLSAGAGGTGGSGGFGGDVNRGANGTGGTGGTGGAAGAGGSVAITAASNAGQSARAQAGAGGTGGQGGSRGNNSGTGNNGNGGNASAGGAGGAMSLAAALTAGQTVDARAGGGGSGGYALGNGSRGGNGGDGGALTVAANSAITAGQAAALAAGFGGDGGFGVGIGGSGGSGGAATVGSAVLASNADLTVSAGNGGVGASSQSAGGNGGVVAINAALAATLGNAVVTAGKKGNGNAGIDGNIAGTAVDVTTAGSVTVRGAINATSGNVSLKAGLDTATDKITLTDAAGGLAGSITVNTPGTENITLQAYDLTNPGGTLKANLVSLTAVAGIGSAGAAIQTIAKSLALRNESAGAAVASGGIYATNTGDVTVAANSVNADVVIKTADGVATGSFSSGSAGTAGGNITVGTVTDSAGALVGITATGSNALTVGAVGGINGITTSGTSGNVYLNAQSVASQAGAAGLIKSTDLVDIRAVAGIGSAGVAINTEAMSLALQNTGAGAINIINTGDVQVAAANANGAIIVGTANGVSGVNAGRSGNITVSKIGGLDGIVSKGGAAFDLSYVYTGSGANSSTGAGGQAGSITVDAQVSADRTLSVSAGRGGSGNTSSNGGNSGNVVINQAISSGADLVVRTPCGSGDTACGSTGQRGLITGSAMNFTAARSIRIIGTLQTSATQNASFTAGSSIGAGEGNFQIIGPGKATFVSTGAAGAGTVRASGTDATFVVGGAGINAGVVDLHTTGALVLDGKVTSSGAGNSLILAGNTLTNNAGADALTTTNAAAGTRWQVYSQSPTGDTFGGLQSGNTAVWGAAYVAPTYSEIPSPSVAATGNRFIFADKQGAVITADDVVKIYGETPALTGYTVTALNHGSAFGNAFTDGAALSGITLGAGGLSSAGSAANATRTGGNAGGSSYDITVDTAQVSGASDYNVTGKAGTLSIDRADLTIRANDVTRTYDGAASGNNAGATYNGLAGGDTASTFDSSLSFSNAGAKNASTYTLEASGVSSANYNIRYDAGTLQIDRRSVALSGLAASDRQYDGTTAVNLSSSGFLTGVGTEVLSITGAAGTLSSADVGKYQVTVSGATLADGTASAGTTAGSASNYVLSGAAGSVNVEITQRQVSISGMSAVDRTYDGTKAATLSGGSISNVVFGETLSFTGATGQFASVNAGTHAVTVSGASLTNGTGQASNYVLTGQPTVANATINKATLSITANGTTRTYDGKAVGNNAGVRYNGFVNDETAAALTGNVNFTNQDARNAGSYSLTPSGQSSGNYAITNVAGNLQIDRANATLSAVTDSRVYNGLAGSNAAPSAIGIVAGDSFTASQSFDSANAGARTLSINPGFTINDGNGGNNYNVSTQTAAGSISQAALTVTANNAARTYDGTTNGNSNGVSYSGFVNLETAANLGGTLAFNNATTRSAGSYQITASGQTSDNYRINYSNGTLTINRAAIGLMGIDASIVQGQADPFFQYVVSSGQLFGADTLTGAAGRAPGSVVGLYAINAGTLANPNYSVTLNGGQLNITAPPVVVPPMVVMPPAPVPQNNDGQILAAELAAITPAPAPLEVASAQVGQSGSQQGSAVQTTGGASATELVDGSSQVHRIKNRKALYVVEGGGLNLPN